MNRMIFLIFCMCIFLPQTLRPQDRADFMEESVCGSVAPALRAAGTPHQVPVFSRTMASNPDANYMIRNIIADANKYTGIINVQIPIYAVEHANGSFPIGVSYCTSGIRSDDLAATVGLGWRLSAGGKISRVVRGKPDNFKQLAVTSNIQAWSLGNFLSWYDEHWDTEPDQYYFELPAMAGSFVFDAERKIHTIPYRDIRIDYDAASDSFKIFDETGSCYYFTTKETTNEKYTYREEEQSYVSSWYLDKIVYLNGDVIRFEYIIGEDYTYRNSVMQTRVVVNCTDPSLVISPNYDNGSAREIAPEITVRGPKYLDRIIYGEQRIDFSYDAGNGDLAAMKSLNTIAVSKVCRTGESQRIRTFCFLYGNFTNRRRKLTCIQEQADSTLIKPICRFEYYEDVNSPRRGSYGIDHWGYYNTENSNYDSKFPTLTLTSDIDSIFRNVLLRGASRTPNLEFTRVMNLRKISYSNGGSREFVYELHRGWDRKNQRETVAGGLRVKQIIVRNRYYTKPSVYNYTYKGGVICDDRQNYILNTYIDDYIMTSNERDYGFDISSRNLSPTVDFWGSSVVYSSVTEELPNRSSVEYVYVSMDDYGDLLPNKYYYPSGSRTLKSRGSEWTGYTPNTLRSWGRFLLKKQISYDADKNVVDSTIYTYKIDSARMVRIPGRTLRKTYRYKVTVDQLGQKLLHYAEYAPVIGEYFSVSCPVYLQKQIVHKGRYNLPQTTEYNYNNSGQLAYLYRTDYDGTAIYTKYRYPQDFPLTDTTTVVGMLKHRNYRQPLEEVTSKYGKVYSAAGRSFRFNENNPGVLVADCEKIKASQNPVALPDFRPVILLDKNLTFNNYYKNRRRYLDYDTSGRLLCYEDENGMRHSFVYKDSTRPVMTVHNARHSENSAYNEVYFNDFEGQAGPPYRSAKSGTQVCSSSPNSTYTIDKKLKPGTYDVIFWHDGNGSSYPWKRRVATLKVTSSATFPVVSFGITGLIDDLCIVPRNAVFSTCEHVPGWGNVSETDEQGFYFKTEYNGLGLPVQVRDMYNTVIRKFEYR